MDDQIGFKITSASAVLGTSVSLTTWEGMWSPYAEEVYTAVLDHIKPTDIVLDIGAGDLRLARCMAEKAEKVYAIEMQSALVEGILPSNLELFVDDARTRPFPTDINTAVLLMRHCTHFGLYWNKLTAVGCQRLITNARWRAGVETIDLSTPRVTYDMLDIGWYACQNGHTGFKRGLPEQLTTKMLDFVNEVSFCPACKIDGYNE